MPSSALNEDSTILLAISSALWGIYTCLFAWFIAIALKRSSMNAPLKAAGVLGYAISTTTLVLHFTVPASAVDESSQSADVALGSLFFLNTLIADSVQTWRAWVLWSRSKAVITVLLIPLSTSLVAGIVGNVFLSRFFQYSIQHSSSNLAHQRWLRGAVDTSDLTLLIASFSGNVLATIFISARIYLHSRGARKATSMPRHHLRHLKFYDRLLAIFIEAGMVYTGIQGAALGLRLNAQSSKFSAGILFPVQLVLVGLYPTSVLVFAHLAKDSTSLSASNPEFTTPRNSVLPTHTDRDDVNAIEIERLAHLETVSTASLHHVNSRSHPSLVTRSLARPVPVFEVKRASRML